MGTGEDLCIVDSTLHILLIEDNAADARLIERELSMGGFDFHARYAESTDQFLHELKQHPPDLILSDHGLAAFDSFEALSAAREQCPDVPFIFVTGSLGEEKTIRAFESGATDCVLKHRLFELLPAVHRALGNAGERQKRRELDAEREQLIQELRTTLAKVKTLGGLLPICSCCKSIRDKQGHWRSLEQFMEAHTLACFTHGICPDCAWRVYGTDVEGKD